MSVSIFPTDIDLCFNDQGEKSVPAKAWTQKILLIILTIWWTRVLQTSCCKKMENIKRIPWNWFLHLTSFLDRNFLNFITHCGPLIMGWTWMQVHKTIFPNFWQFSMDLYSKLIKNFQKLKNLMFNYCVQPIFRFEFRVQTRVRH